MYSEILSSWPVYCVEETRPYLVQEPVNPYNISWRDGVTWMEYRFILKRSVLQRSFIAELYVGPPFTHKTQICAVFMRQEKLLVALPFEYHTKQGKVQITWELSGESVHIKTNNEAFYNPGVPLAFDIILRDDKLKVFSLKGLTTVDVLSAFFRYL
jgi:hypothetical protein